MAPSPPVPPNREEAERTVKKTKTLGASKVSQSKKSLRAPKQKFGKPGEENLHQKFIEYLGKEGILEKIRMVYHRGSWSVDPDVEIESRYALVADSEENAEKMEGFLKRSGVNAGRDARAVSFPESVFGEENGIEPLLSEIERKTGSRPPTFLLKPMAVHQAMMNALRSKGLLKEISDIEIVRPTASRSTLVKIKLSPELQMVRIEREKKANVLKRLKGLVEESRKAIEEKAKRAPSDLSAQRRIMVELSRKEAELRDYEKKLVEPTARELEDLEKREGKLAAEAVEKRREIIESCSEAAKAYIKKSENLVRRLKKEAPHVLKMMEIDPQFEQPHVINLGREGFEQNTIAPRKGHDDEIIITFNGGTRPHEYGPGNPNIAEAIAHTLSQNNYGINFVLRNVGRELPQEQLEREYPELAALLKQRKSEGQKKG